MPELPATPDCCWTASAPDSRFPRLTGHSECDVVVVGAGIVGLSAAMTLCEAGKSVVVIEARDVGRQVTGRSTAKITTQHALIYRHLIDTFGQELAQCYADANREAVDRIRHWVETLQIDCDYQRESAFAYACSPDWRAAIEQEAEAARRLGFAARVLEQAPLPFATAGALEFPDQAQFNPASYLVGLAAAIEARGGRIHQQTRAQRFERQQRWQVGFEGGSIEADQVILATHMPVETPIDLASPTQPRCHVAMAFRPTEGAHLPGMFIGVDEPTHSIRMGRDAEGPLLIVLGPRFRTGQDGDVARRFVDLENWARSNLPAGEPVWRWCNEDYDTADRVAYVGEPDPKQSPGLFVATGFNGWGISNGTAAGLGIARQIITGRRPWKHLYDPNRPAPDDYNQSSDSQSQVDGLDAIGRGEGGVITRDDEKIAVWRDDAGALHAVSAACTHMGCTVTWNNADRTWDCPCHGSIFQADGDVIHGPAIEPLAARSL
ncbi:FAD-dependent oxidoreductase [Stutzerimonas nosocomialis]|uniref:FAD-dependent oxidoreductase n=1 Tax=Stutzerimonas nosocomialis TaxID=1056496 RepID=UPI001108E388|nr:FAD-dependent oxidoreductase [Stutzerimonas nosocomialis]TLX58535.1 FAD-dependent oxidoreductase [Stutzerimonas nosocomialis]